MIAEKKATRYRAYGCPSCGASPEDAAPEVASRITAESLGLEELGEQWRGFFKEKSFFTYDRCRCGMLYSTAYFSQEQLDALYASMGANMEGVAGDSLQRTQRGYFTELRKVSPLSGNFLEIGPDVGLFTEYCAKEGDFSSFWLCEPNRAVHGELLARVGGKPARITTSLLDIAEVPDASISVAAMIHVLDHILEPVAFLKTLKTKLAPGGIAMIVTHDERSMLARVLKARWPAFCLQHPHLFNRSSMQNMLAQGGLRTLSIVPSVNHFPVTYLAKHLAYALKLGELPLPAWPQLQLPLRLGNMITFARPA